MPTIGTVRAFQRRKSIGASNCMTQTQELADKHFLKWIGGLAK